MEISQSEYFTTAVQLTYFVWWLHAKLEVKKIELIAETNKDILVSRSVICWSLLVDVNFHAMGLLL